MSQQRKINISKDRLNNLYQKHSMREIAEIIGCGQTLIFNRIKEYKITLKGFEKGGHRKKTGKIFSEEHRKNLSLANTTKAGDQNPNWKGGKIEIICLNCIKPFPVIRARKNTAKFCGYKCRDEWRANNWLEDNHPNYNKYAPRRKICLSPSCMKQFKQKKTEAISIFIERKFCSKKCADKDGFRYKGRDHPNFKEDSRRKSYRGKQGSWQKKVFSRDKNTCQHCKTTNVPIVAHHIKEFENFKDLRWDVDNGITLCEPCHWKTHEYNMLNDLDITVSILNGRTIRRWGGNCDWCGSFISKRASDLKKYDGTNALIAHHFCDKKCAGMFRRGKSR